MDIAGERASSGHGPVVDFGDGTAATVAAALWAFAEDQGLVANCSAQSILSAFEVGFNVQFSPEERRFRQKLVFVLLDALGCVFYDDAPIEPIESLVGWPIEAVKTLSFPAQIAVLDALFTAYAATLPCDRVVTIAGSHREKAQRRTAAICDEVTAMRAAFGPARGGTVSLIGVSRLQAVVLQSRGFAIRAFDQDADYVGTTILPGVTVQRAARVEELVADADIALITGMTIGNNSLPAILRAAARTGVKTVCWAVTAANIAPVYRALGLTSAVCEGFPPYFLPGETKLRIFRQPAAQAALDRAPRAEGAI
jgi:Putative heavy-metal chelation